MLAPHCDITAAGAVHLSRAVCNRIETCNISVLVLDNNNVRPSPVRAPPPH